MTGKEEVVIEAGNNLNVTTIANTSSSSSQFQSITFGNSNIGFAVGESSSSSSWAGNQASITSGDKLDISVAGNTDLVGSIIGSSTGNMNLTTNTLTTSNIDMHETSSSESFSLGISLPILNTDKPSKPSVNIGINTSDKDKQGLAIATIGGGNINTNSDVSMVNRDPTQSLLVTSESSSGVNINLAIPIEILTNTSNYVNGGINGLSQIPQLPGALMGAIGNTANVAGAGLSNVFGENSLIASTFNATINPLYTAIADGVINADVHWVNANQQTGLNWLQTEMNPDTIFFKPPNANPEQIAAIESQGGNQVGQGNVPYILDDKGNKIPNSNYPGGFEYDKNLVGKPISSQPGFKPCATCEGGTAMRPLNAIPGFANGGESHDPGISGHEAAIIGALGSTIGKPTSNLWTPGSIPLYFIPNYIALTLTTIKDPATMLPQAGQSMLNVPTTLINSTINQTLLPQFQRPTTHKPTEISIKPKSILLGL